MQGSCADLHPGREQDDGSHRGAAGQLPGELLGGEGSIEFSTGDLYATLLLDTYEQEIEIPEEVLNTPVSGEEELDIDLGALLGDSGVMNELGSED